MNPSPRTSRLRQTAGNLLLLLTTTIACIALAELALRTKQAFAGVPFLLSKASFSDPELGWTGRRIVAGNPSGKKLLVIGDSFTEGLGVPDEALYISQLAKLLDTSVVAYAGRGYGTLQEYLVLRKLLAEVHPDIIVLQLCANDFLNNSWELERHSYLQNALLPRPYLTDSGIELLYPRRFPKLRGFLEGHLRLFEVGFTKSELAFHELARTKQIRTIEDSIIRSRGRLPEFRRAVETTGRILTMITAVAGDIPIVAFEADEIPPYHAAFREIADRAALPLLSTVSTSIMDAEKRREKMRLPDKVHWNEAGHRVVAEALRQPVQLLLAGNSATGAL